MPVYLDKKTKRFFIQFQLHGEPYKERLPDGITRKDAETIEIKVKAQMLFEQHGIESQTEQTFERFIQDVYLPYVESGHSALSFQRSIDICKAALKFLKGKKLRQIKPFDIEQFKRSRMDLPTQYGTPRKPATVARELSIISKVFSMAVKNDLLDYNPCSKVERPRFDNVMNRVLRIEDEEKFFASFDKEKGGWAKDICRVALETGLRQNDILNLSKFHVDLSARLIRLVQGKTKRRHQVKMTQSVFEILERRMKLPGPLLFPSPKTGGVAKGIRTAIAHACTIAKIEKITIRDLRRTLSTRLDDMHFSSATIAKVLGHSDLRSVHRYQRGTGAVEDAISAIEKMSHRANIIPLAKIKKVK